MGQFLKHRDSPWAVSCQHFKQMNSSPLCTFYLLKVHQLQQMFPPVRDPSCRAFLIPTWGFCYEAVHCGQAGDICCPQEPQESPFPKHSVCPNTAVRTATRRQVPHRALTFPFLPGQHNPPNPMPVPAPRHPTTTIFLQWPMMIAVVPSTALLFQRVPVNT